MNDEENKFQYGKHIIACHIEECQFYAYNGCTCVCGRCFPEENGLKYDFDKRTILEQEFKN